MHREQKTLITLRILKSLKVHVARLTVTSVSGFNPSWNESFQFGVSVPELALVRFVIEDYDSSSSNEFVAQYTLPFTSLKMGEFAQVVKNTRQTQLRWRGIGTIFKITKADYKIWIGPCVCTR